MKLKHHILIFFVIFMSMMSCANSNVNYSDFTNDTESNLPAPIPEPELVPYEGRLLHIFFHPLVARPETAFKSRYRQHFLDWYVTAFEYKNILQELYANNYVLVDVNDTYEIISMDNRDKFVYKKPLVPPGKKPMLISIDDLSYYKFVRENASVHKLIIDNKGEIAAWSDNGNGGEISYDLDAVTYLEEFIKKHPDFSARGARGIIALTGFEGVLGYATHKLNTAEYEEEKQKAAAVVNKLKELGWRFASHSWEHSNLPEISAEQLRNDTNRWDREVRPVVGDTNIFIYPFGAGVENIEEKHRILREKKFNAFYGVGSGFDYRENNQYIYFDRKNIDGYYFRMYRNRADRLFDIEKIIDPLRLIR